MDRRIFFKYSILSMTALPLSRMAGAERNATELPMNNLLASNPVCVFVKPLEKYKYDELAVLLSEVGFDGADISLRKPGLIIPETAKTELPKLIAAFTKQKVIIPMAVAGITSASEPGAEDLIHLMADNGIKYYRLGAIAYDRTISMKANLDSLKKRMEKLCELNARYKVHGAIQNHVGAGLGAPVWDAYAVMKDCDPDYLGLQYDIRHAVAEGMGSWPLALEAALNHIRTTCIKDFTWMQDRGSFKPVTVPIGEGIVPFKKYFEVLNKGSVNGPVSIHYEYPLLTKEQDGLSTAEQMKVLIPKLKHDLDSYKEMIKQSY